MPAHPDPTFHASAKLAMQAPPEKLAYTVMLSPDFSRPAASRNRTSLTEITFRNCYRRIRCR